MAFWIPDSEQKSSGWMKESGLEEAPRCLSRSVLLETKQLQ